MKTSGILLTVLLLFGTGSSYAQKIYLRGGLGISVSTAAGYSTNYSISSSSNSYTTSAKKQGYGTGLPFVLAAGYHFNEHFGIELGVDYFYGFTIKQTMDNTSSTYENKSHGQMLSIVPAFVMSLPFDKLTPYARIGLKLGVLNSVNNQSHSVDNYPSKSTASTDIASKARNYGGIAIGVQTAVGTDFKLSNLLSLFGEIQVDGISYSPVHGKYTEYSMNGIDQMGSRTTKQNKWDFKKDIT